MSSDIRESLQSLQRIRGVIGVCLHFGPNVVENLFPKAFGQNRVDDLCMAVHDFFEGYKKTGRVYNELCIKFNGGTVYSVDDNNHMLSYLLEDITPVPLIGSASQIFLKDNKGKIRLPLPASHNHAAVEVINPAVWAQFQQQLIGVMGKVIGTSSSRQLLARILASMGGTMEQGVPASRFKELALSLVLEIPNRSKQEVLRSEIDSIIKNINS
jgi:hypothetical protein